MFFLNALVSAIGLSILSSFAVSLPQHDTTSHLAREIDTGSAFGAVFGDIVFILDKFDKKPWDTTSGNCVIEVKEAKGGNCVAASSPAGESAYTTYKDWNVCYLGGQQYFTFPDAPGRPGIGRVRIEYTAKDCCFSDNSGYCTQGLCKPQLVLLDHDQPIVFDMWKTTGNENDKKNLCHFQVFDNYWNSWKCGVPCRNQTSVHHFT